ncbi:MAG: hypothetical protein M5R38_05460 [Candidatus Methylomirabilis sp.]|nr:hypothetical protein [Candidatus Methylomirabilis sp.]
MKRFSIGSAVMAGFLGTLAMTALMYMAPLMGLPKMDLIGALGQALPIGLPTYLTGSLVHLFNGVVLAMIYAVAFATWLPGPTAPQGRSLLHPSLDLCDGSAGAGPDGAAFPLGWVRRRTGYESMRRGGPHESMRRRGCHEPVCGGDARRGNRAECDAHGGDESDGPLALRCRHWGGVPREGLRRKPQPRIESTS